MFGHGCLLGVADFCAGVGVVGVEVVGVEVVGVEVVGAAPAPAMPIAAPPAPSAPAMIVALSILEMCIGLAPPVDGMGLLSTIMRPEAKRRRRCL